MKVGILSVGQISSELLIRLGQGLAKIFPDTSCWVIDGSFLIPLKSFNKKRNQYNSRAILNEIMFLGGTRERYDRVLGVVDTDIYASGLSFVFGEAYSPGKVALISLWRLKPPPNGESVLADVFEQRSLKEAVHELGHTLGLEHCHNALCVMHFSNSLIDTDKKQSLLCGQCYLQATLAIGGIGRL